MTKWLRFLCNLYSPGLLNGVGKRKAYIETAVRNELSIPGSGGSRHAVEQVLVVASGYDTLALRLAEEFPHVLFYEVDHPATMAVKRKAVQLYQMSDEKSIDFQRQSSLSNLRFIAADLTKTPLKNVLLTEDDGLGSYDITKPTAVVMEGLTMYLHEDDLLNLFNSTAEVVGPKSTISFDFFGWKDNKPPVLMAAKVQFLGESWHWSIEPKNLERFLMRTKWSLLHGPVAFGIEHLATLVKR